MHYVTALGLVNERVVCDGKEPGSKCKIECYVVSKEMEISFEH